MNTQQLPLVRALPSNQRGRDFVVGDLHGCFDLLDRLLETVRFDPGCDRLFSVGGWWITARFAAQSGISEAPWFYAVQGSHEHMLLKFLSPIVSGSIDYLDRLAKRSVWLNGEPWLADDKWVTACYFPDEQRMTPAFDRLLEHLRDLPLLWVVGSGLTAFMWCTPT